MYPKYFFERFWESEQKNELFVCMPFDDSFDKKFEIINKIAKNLGFLNANRVKENKSTAIITDEIYEGIANSKFLLFDLSNDPKYDKKHPNLNVMYELGIAVTIREPGDIIIIKDLSEEIEKLPFDIRTIRIHRHPENIDEALLKKELEDGIKNQEWYKSKRVKSAIESLDEIGLGLIYQIGYRPKGYNHFNSMRMPIEVKFSISRLIDLGILKFECICYPERKGFETAYHWTAFGYAVMEKLGIRQISEEEFKKTEEYKIAVEDIKSFFETKEKILANRK